MTFRIYVLLWVKYFYDVVSEDIKSISRMYKNYDTLKGLKVNDFLLERPKSIVLLMGTLVGVDLYSKLKSEVKNITGLCFLLEQFYNLRNQNFIGPLSFCIGLIKWSLTGSKLSHNIDSVLSASGSITTMKNTLKDWSLTPNACFPENDIDIYFDNTQKVGKTRRVREGGSTPMDVATNVIFIQNEQPTHIQSRQDLKPSLWQLASSDDVLKLHNDSVTEFQSYKRNSCWNKLYLPHSLKRKWKSKLMCHITWLMKTEVNVSVLSAQKYTKILYRNVPSVLITQTQ